MQSLHGISSGGVEILKTGDQHKNRTRNPGAPHEGECSNLPRKRISNAKSTKLAPWEIAVLKPKDRIEFILKEAEATEVQSFGSELETCWVSSFG